MIKLLFLCAAAACALAHYHIAHADHEETIQEAQTIENDVGYAVETTPPLPNENQTPPVETPKDETVPAIDTELLTALGEALDDVPKYGEKIHPDLAQRWLPILRKGIEKENKDKLIKEYTIPENCKLLRAPLLNAEIAAAITDIARGRDEKIETSQQQLGVGISAVNRAMTLLVTTDDKPSKVQAIKILSDGCRILSDLHYLESQTRMKLATPGLDKVFLNEIQDVERDETLFGSKLSDKIKASKAIEKQSQQIKKPVVTAALAGPSTSHAAPPAYSRYPGNWTRPARFQSPNRRGRGGPPRYSAATRRPPATTYAQTQPTCTAEAVTQNSGPELHPVYPGCSEALRRAFSSRGAPEASLNLMLASLSKNTLLQYNVSYKLWWKFSIDNHFNLYNGSISHVLLFLTNEFNKGSSYGSLNNHRSALSLLLGSSTCSDDQIKRLMKGIYKLKPVAPKYSNTWDPQLVLNHITTWYPNREISLEKITKKLSILLAICTAHRVQTLSLIKLNNINMCPNGVKIIIDDIIKTSGAGRAQPILFLPYFQDNKNICPATVIEDYLHVTSNIRNESSQNLLLTFKKPHKNASAQSISRWIKQVLGESGIDIGAFSAHSTRHASTSAAHRAGVSLDAIRKAAGWSTTSETFARFYHRQLIDEGSPTAAAPSTPEASAKPETLANPPAPGPVTVTPSGVVRGSWMISRLGRRFQAYRGIRYARPPVGELRFQPPVDMVTYPSEVDAREDGPSCPLPVEPGEYYVDEDCLRINVYTPENNRNSSRKLPVIFFIHPGGFFSMTGRSDLFGPDYLLDRDIVLVTINYRLASLGFLSTGDSVAPGNNGFKDQVSALRWVQRNIASFGGDPGKVTIAGCSAGSVSVMLHMISSMSKGLFHRGIAMSASPMGKRPLPTHQLALAQKQAKILNCPTHSSRAIVDCLKTKTWQEIGNSLVGFWDLFGSDPIGFWDPVVEPDVGQPRFLAVQPDEAVRKGQIHAVPLLISQTEDEFYWKAFSVTRNKTLLNRMNAEWETIAPISFALPAKDSAAASRRLKEAYLGGKPVEDTPESNKALGKLYGDSWVGLNTHRMANLMCRHSPQPVWYSLFSYIGNNSFYEDPRTGKPAGAAHHDDLIYLFSMSYFRPPIKVRSPPPPAPQDHIMVERMTAIWYTFAKHGDPNPRKGELPELSSLCWPVMRPADRQYLKVDRQFSVHQKLHEAQLRVWDELYPMRF